MASRPMGISSVLMGRLLPEKYFNKSLEVTRCDLKEKLFLQNAELTHYHLITK